MNDDKLNNELDDFFRAELENLPVEKPSAVDWERMNKRIHAEGLLKSNSNGRKYLLLFLLLLFLSGLGSLPFLLDLDKAGNNKITNNNKSTLTDNNIDKTRTVKPIGTAGEKYSSDENTASEISNTGQTQATEAAAANTISGERNERPGGLLGANNTARNDNAGKNGLSPAERDGVSNNDGKQEAPSSSSPEMSPGNDDRLVKNDTDNPNSPEPGINTDIPQAGTQDGKMIPDAVTVTGTDTTPQSLPVVVQQDSTPPVPEIKTEEESSSQLKRFRLGLYVSWDYNYYALKENNNVAQAEADIVSQNSFIEGEDAGQYTIGIIGGYLFSQKLSIEAGAFYSQKKKLHADIYTQAYSTSEGEMFSDFSYDFKARYFEIYGRGKYYLSQKKNSFYATLGAAAGYNLPSNDSSDYFSRVSYSESGTAAERVSLDASSVSFTLVISAGMEIPLGKNWDVYIEPAYRYAFTPVVQHPAYDRIPVEHFLRSFSLATGLMFRF